MDRVYNKFGKVPVLTNTPINNLCNSGLDDGIYVLDMNNKIILVKKYQDIKGTIYKNVHNKITVFYKWYLIPLIDRNLNEIVNNNEIYEPLDNPKILDESLPITQSFSFSKIEPESLIYIFGKAGPCKTLLVQKILDNSNANQSDIYIISNIDKYNLNYSSKYPQAKIDNEINIFNINTFLNKSEGIIVLDDILSYRGDWSKNKRFMDIFNCNKLKIVNISNPGCLTQDIKMKANYLVFFKDDPQLNIKYLFETYCDKMFPSFCAFTNTMNSLQNNECIIINVHKKVCYIDQNLIK